MAEHGAKVPPASKGGEDAGDTLFPGLFVSWDEITRDDIAAFESALDGARDERDMQRFLEANPRMLIQHLVAGRGAWVIPKKRLGSEHETDFVIAQKASGGPVWYAVELERPQAKMFNKNGDPSAALTHALRQISDWRIWLSHNLDYAARPPERSGLGLIDIYPDLEGLIIIGRNAEVDQRTNALRREWVCAHRVEIETYDWLLFQANEHLAALERAGKRHPAAASFDALLSDPRLEKPARKAVNEVFGGTSTGWANTSVVRGEIEWEGVELWPDAHPDDNGIAPLQIVYTRGMPADKFLSLSDWNGWIDHVTRNLAAKHSLLVTEIAPAAMPFSLC